MMVQIKFSRFSVKPTRHVSGKVGPRECSNGREKESGSPTSAAAAEPYVTVRRWRRTLPDQTLKSERHYFSAVGTYSISSSPERERERHTERERERERENKRQTENGGTNSL